MSDSHMPKPVSAGKLIDSCADRELPRLPPGGRAATFDELAALEPRLAELLAEAKSCRPEPGKPFCANAVWYGYCGHPGIKPRLLSLVGWERRPEHPILSTSAAYNVAYDTIYETLPYCRDCFCIAVE